MDNMEKQQGNLSGEAANQPSERRFSLKNLNLRAKLVLVFLAVTLVPISILGILNNVAIRSTLTARANEGLLTNATQTTIILDNFIKSNLDAVRAEAQLPDFVAYLSLPADERAGTEIEKKVITTLNTLFSKESTFTLSYALLDTKGINVIDTQTEDIGINRAEEAYFQEPIRGGLPYVSPVQFSPATRREADLYLSSPVRNDNREIIGVLVLHYDATILQELITQNLDVDAEISTVLLDEYNIRLADTGNTDLIFKAVGPFTQPEIAQLKTINRLPDLPEAELSTVLPDFEAGLQQATSDSPYFSGVLYPGDALQQGAIAELERLPWRVVTVQSRSLLLAPVDTQTRRALVVFMVLIIAVAIIAIIISQWLARPIVQLTDIATRITGGDLTVQAGIKSGDEIGTLATAFNSMTRQLRELFDSLEERVKARTQRLESVANITERLTAILNLGPLLVEIVEQIKENFAYYHAHIYLLDQTKETLIVAAGAGEPGRLMVAQGHHIAFNAPTSLVARAARTGQTIRVDNVREASDWLPNELLPETYSEMAVPIVLDEQVVGVLDVQHDKIAGLDEGDANLLRSLAGQVAVAMRNARLFEEVETALADLQEAQARYIDKVWDKKYTTKGGHSHLYSPVNVVVNEKHHQTFAKVRQEALTLEQPTVITVDNETDKRYALVSPIQVRGQTIGDIQLHTPDPHIWDEDKVAIVQAVLEQIGQTAESLRLFGETRQRAYREQVIREITNKMRGAVSLDQLVKTAAEELGQRFATELTVVELGVDEASLDGSK